MFYSHQLLCKKGPLGQIWIAATMHPKMNRKRTDQVDIQDSCMQIINPSVPLALRLSGILMGGIVRIYNHKVKFFCDDVTQFMMKMQTKPEKSMDTRTLPPRKTRARHEDITLDSVDDLSHDYEQPMVQPDTPEQDDDFFTLPSPPAKSAARANKFQAETEDITLDDNMRSLSDELDDTIRVDNQERFQQPSSFIDDDIDIRVREGEFQSDLKTPDGPEPNTLSPIVEEEVPPAARGAEEDSELVKPDSDQAPKSPEPQKTRKRRNVSKKPKKKLIIDETMVEIPAETFRSWLEDTSTITHRKRKAYTGVASERAKAMFGYPSTYLACSGKDRLPHSLLPASILDMWKTELSRRQDATEGSRKREEMSPPSQDRRQDSMQTPEQSSKASGSPGGNIGVDMSPKMPTFDFEEPEQFEAPLNFEDFGSAEKLRSAVRTPMSEDGLFDSQFGVTPTLSGNGNMTSKRGRTSQSDKLLPDDYLTPATRSKRSRHKNISPLDAELTNKEFFLEKTPDITVIPDIAEPSRAAQQRELDKLTSIMLQYLREHFSSTNAAKELSLENLTEGMDPSQAAKMFYHTCVLISNRYLSVTQQRPYGDIIISRSTHF